MEDGRCKDSFDSMTYSVPEIYEISETCLSFVYSDDMSFDGNRPYDDRQEELLCFFVCRAL